MSDEIKVDQKTIKSLSSETRIEILKNLDIRQMTVTELSRKLDLAKSTVHEHLKKMEDADLVEKVESKSKWSYYMLTYKGKRLLHPTEGIKIMVLLTFSLLALAGGFIELLGYGMTPSSGGSMPAAQEMLKDSAETLAAPAPEMVVTSSNREPQIIGALLILAGIALAFSGVKRWRKLGQGHSNLD